MFKINNKRWISRTVLGIGMASFFSDLGHEAATAILPMFLVSIGAAPAALGMIEGVSDAMASFSKLGAGWYSDRLRSRKPMAVIGYLLTGISKASFALSTTWFHVLIGRTLAWFGRGIRGPVRDAILTDAVPPEVRGRAFGFDRALDTLGAVIGPIVALWLVGFSSYRTIFFLTLIPGMFAALSFAIIVKEKPRTVLQPTSFRLSFSGLPLHFKKFMIAVGIFGMGDFAHTLLIYRATQIFTADHKANAAQLAVLLYVVHNVVYAVASYPVGALADKIGKRTLLVVGYVLSGVMCLGFLYPTTDFLFVGILFVIAGFYIAIEDSLERALAADMLPSTMRGTGFGVLAATNGIGDFISSSFIGIIWTTTSVETGFIVAAGFSFLGAFLVRILVPNKYPTAV